MKIVIDLTSLADNFTGIERYAACIAREMVKQKEHEYVLIFKEAIHGLFQEVKEQENVECVVFSRCSKLLFNQMRLPWALRKIKADWYLFMAFPVPVLLFKKNMISTIHDICCWDCPETMNGPSKWYFRISHRIAMWKCRYIITISEFSKKRIVERLKYPEEKLLLVYCGIDEQFGEIKKKREDILEKYHLPEEYILSLSTLEPRKNLMLLVKAYERLVVEDNLSIPLVLAGRKGWKINELFSDIQDNVRKQIIFTGFIEDEDLSTVYRQAKLFVFPSKYEGFGIPPLEAMACGVPVLSSDAASMPEVLGDACVYFKSEDEVSLVGKMNDMINMPDDNRENMIKKGYDEIERFHWKKEAKHLMNVFSNERI